MIYTLGIGRSKSADLIWERSGWWTLEWEN